MAELDTPRVGVLYGGISSEREISLITGTAVGKALRAAGYPVEMIDIREVPLCELTRERMDVAFVALHGTFGEDGGIQAVLDAMGVPYTGSGVEASRLAMDKVAAKERFRRDGVPTPRFVEIDIDWPERRQLRVARSLGFPVVLKPVREGSSIGVVIARDDGELAAGLGKPFEYDHRVFAEEYIDGRELTVGILHDRALPIIELQYATPFFDFRVKYEQGAAHHVVSPKLLPDVARAVQDAALGAHQGLGCEGLTRVDLRLGRDGVPYVLEVNTIPGMTATSLLPEAAGAAGVGFPELCEHAVRLALGLPTTVAASIEV
ncbi:MAG: D-alanine--D-alanine ligase [bacterium]